MATQKKALAVCDTCGFVYPHRVMRLNSYGLLVCPQDFEGQYDLKNSPQNKVPNIKDNPAIKNPRPDDGGRGVLWDDGTMYIKIDLDEYINDDDDPLVPNPNYGKQTRQTTRPEKFGLLEGSFPNITSWITVDPTTLEETRHITQYDDANRSWDLI